MGRLTPADGTIELLGSESQIDSLRWTPAGGTSVIARRVRLREEATHFQGDGVTLDGTVIAPLAAGPFPGIVFLHGSGAETRESSRVYAYLLAHQGVASLIYDKRGSGASTGASFNAPFASLATDAAAALERLRRQPHVKSDRVGFFGPSQGSWVALAATTRANPPDFLILQSGDAGTPLEQEMYRGEQLLRSRTNLSDAEIRDAVAFRRQKFLYAITGDHKSEYESALSRSRGAPWMVHIGDKLPDASFWRPNGLFDPAPAMASYNGPVLALFGASDTNKNAGEVATAMRAAFAVGHNDDVTVIVFPSANHGLFETKTGAALERELPDLTRIAPGVIDSLRSWIDRHTRTRQ